MDEGWTTPTQLSNGIRTKSNRQMSKFRQKLIRLSHFQELTNLQVPSSKEVERGSQNTIRGATGAN